MTMPPSFGAGRGAGGDSSASSGASGFAQRLSAPTAQSAPVARLNPRRTNVLAVALLIIGIVVGVGMGAYGYVESRRTEPVVIAVRDVPYGRQIVADDLGVVDMPFYRPKELEGFTNQNALIGQYAARDIRANDLVQPSMVSPDPPDEAVYPNGRKLAPNMVAAAFSLGGVGPITDRDRINIGFISSDPTVCDRTKADVAPGTVLPPPPPIAIAENARSYACRWMSGVPILYIEEGVAYLEMTPAQAHALRALQAAGVSFWAERYGSSSAPLQYMDRIDASQVILPDLARPVTETLRVEPLVGGAAPVPGSQSAPIPGSSSPDTEDAANDESGANP